MTGALLDTLFGPLGGLLAGIVAAGLALLLGMRQGASQANSKRNAEDMADAYNREKTRAEIDRNTGGSDARDRLHKDWRRD